MHTKTLKFRVRDKHRNELAQQACAVNFVWNYINELSARNIRDRGVFLSAFDLHPYTKGANKELGLHSQTLQCIAKEYVTRRKQFKKHQLNWRKSFGVRRSLGWIPVNTGAAKWKNGQIFFNGKYYRIWDSYGLSKYRFRTASFSEDSRGRWYFNVVVAFEAQKSSGTKSVGLDLGCKESVTDSNGEGIKGREYRKLETKLGIAQRANNKNRVKAIHAKIRNRRQDELHKYSRKLVNENAAIFVGNVSSSKLVKTKMAKSVLDASWSTLKTILEYKCAVRREVARLIVAENATYFSMSSTLREYAIRVIRLCKASQTMYRAAMPSPNREEVDKHWKHYPVTMLGYPSGLTYVNT